MTHTYAMLEVSASAYDEIAEKLKAAGYDHAFMVGEDVNGHSTIDMQGLGITRAEVKEPDYRHQMMGPCLQDCTEKRIDCGHILCPYKTWNAA